MKGSQCQDTKKEMIGFASKASGDQQCTSSVTSPLITSKSQHRVGSTSSAPLIQCSSLGGISHSITTGSISKKLEKDKVGITPSEKNIGVSEQLSMLLSSYPATSPGCWLCSYLDLPHLSTFSVATVNCPSENAVKQAMGQIVNTILNFCNSNSSNPPVTFIGIIGADKFVGQILRAYVDCLHHKSSSNWLHYLRFAVIPAPHSLIAKLIEGIDVALDQLCRDMWERWADLSSADKQAVTEKMNSWIANGGGCLNLPIGEALLQMTEKGQEADACRVFVPFLAEVRVGQSSEDEDAGCTYSSPRTVEVERENVVSAREYYSGLSSSPPNSPHIRTDAHEMHVEYWLGRDPSNENTNTTGAQNLTPNSKKDLTKGSIKATFRTLDMQSSTLVTIVCKGEEKEKMLQKLGMKKGQKSENENPVVQVAAVSRLLCSGASKHSDLTVSVDGSVYERVRYFQCSSQWQTHIKSFPVSLITHGAAPIAL
ncbi:hypothetical protein NECAME_03738 [Necator americanus]|uniref:Phosphofurin acidic cluster sorting protein 1/2 C-terminal domain-containing protein n=1 Tax=Necator americanus TaxID=51031 RepID=W2T0X3_NECAM|nr:hypothetical protein NECAME_03738 [Necator americanus]ETN75548.1 hypothetical protein NECAME_03738 [Necator americanus]